MIWEVEVRRNYPPDRWIEVVPCNLLHQAIEIALTKMNLVNVMTGSYQVTVTMQKEGSETYG